MDSGGYATRVHNPAERLVKGNTHGLYFIFFLLEHVTTAVPAICLSLAAVVTSLTGGSWRSMLIVAVAIPVAAVLIFAATMVALSNKESPDGPADWEQYIDLTDAKLREKYKGRKIPIETFVSAYLDQRAEFKADPLQVMWKRFDIFRFNITLGHAWFFVGKFTGQLVHHSQAADSAEVRDVYDRGNDFYRWFLGPRMVYTSGVFENQDESLEDAQDRKIDIVLRKINLQPGETLLDIGCGWGTLVCQAAKNFGARATGVTLAREQVEWGYKQAEEMGVRDRVELLCMDYRDIPRKTYDKITSLEMIEHVGIKNVQSFLLQVRDMLKDDGMFYLQLAGLRRAWQFEDLIWGLFMGSYIFPAADASCPLGFCVTQAERAGFEVHSVENCGVHYSLTINHWYNNWMGNKEAVIAKYGEWWFRCWVIFLSWSVIIASQGSSTVFFVTLHKNTSRFERRDAFVGPYPIATQQ